MSGPAQWERFYSLRLKEMLIKAIPGLNQLALPEARLVERCIFNGLAPLEMAGPPWPARETL